MTRKPHQNQIVIESGSTDRPQLPTLRKIFHLLGKGEYSLTTYVKTIFRNSKYGNYTLVTELDYRIILYKGTPVYNWLDSNLEDLADEAKACLRIDADLEKEGQFKLIVETEYDPIWRAFDWGFAIDNNPTT